VQNRSTATVATMIWPFGDLAHFGFRVILCDPPWDFVGGGDRNARNKYPTMTPAEIKALPVGHLASGNCALFLWVTDPFLEEGLATLRAWGFRYASVAFHWAKRTPLDTGWHMGTGYGTRANVETCLLGVNGSMGLPKNRDVRRLVVAPVREHSRKPDRIRSDIERLYEGPYAELFARSRREGWSTWGNEVTRFG
jgi:N6-adenosine-specific RNA methylase IME4